MSDYSAPPDDHDPGGSPREVIAAWLLVVILLIGTAISFALDQMVTVSDQVADEPDWSQIKPAAAGDDDEDEITLTPRETRDLDRR
jgi:hypothetical protein